MEHKTYVHSVALVMGNPMVEGVHAAAVLMQKWAMQSIELGLYADEYAVFFTHTEDLMTLTAVHVDDVFEYRAEIPFLEYKGVSIYHVWDGTEMSIDQFTTDKDDVLDGDLSFDVETDLESPKTIFVTGDDEIKRQRLREAIDAGEIQEDGLNDEWEAPDEDDE